MKATVDAFLAAVSEGGWPPTSIEYRYLSWQPFVDATRVVVIVRWWPPMPESVGRRARELTGLASAHPISFQCDLDGVCQGWYECWLQDGR